MLDPYDRRDGTRRQAVSKFAALLASVPRRSQHDLTECFRTLPGETLILKP